METLKEFYNVNSYYTRMRKKKKICNEELEKYEVDLCYTIHHAEGLDNPISFPGVTDRNYKVFSWIDSREQFYTYLVQGFPNPVWKQTRELTLKKDMDCRFLNVEVVRYRSITDPGTSNGMVVVGRARIPLPKELSTKKVGRFRLNRMVGSELKGEGHIIVSMELKAIRLLP